MTASCNKQFQYNIRHDCAINTLAINNVVKIRYHLIRKIKTKCLLPTGWNR